MKNALIPGILVAVTLVGCATAPYEAPRGVVWGYIVPGDGRPKGFDLLGYWPNRDTCQARSAGATCRPLIVGEGSQQYWAYNFYGVKPGSFAASHREGCELLRQKTTAQTSQCTPITVRFVE